MAQFDRAIQTALRLIAKNGQTVAWNKKVITTPNPDRPQDKVETSNLYYPKICFLPLDLQGREFLMSLPGGEAASGAFYGLMGQVAFTPDRGDIVTRDGTALNINSIDLLSPNGQKVLYTIIFNG